MSVRTLPVPKRPAAAPFPPTRKRWTVPEFHRLWEEGWFDECRPMLVNGEIYEMAIPGPLHSTGVGLADYVLKAVFARGFYVRVQMPLVLGLRSDLVPDLAVVSGAPRDYVDHPTSALLVVEVSDTSLAMDTGEKVHVYAASGVADYWVLDLNNRQLIVYRDPRPDPASPLGSAYGTVTRLVAGQFLSPLANPGATVNVADLLP